jgi:hypothetical protein
MIRSGLATKALGSPHICVALLIVAFAFAFVRRETSEGFRLERTLDSWDYQAASGAGGNMRVALTSRRPPVYPALLTVARSMSADYSALPYVQFVLFAGASVIFFLCCLYASMKPWESLLLSPS